MTLQSPQPDPASTSNDGLVRLVDVHKIYQMGTQEVHALAGVTLSYLDAWRLFAEATGARRPWCRAGPLMLRLAGWGGDLWTRLTGHEPAVNSGALALAGLPKSYTSRRAEAELGYTIRPTQETIRDAWEWFQKYGYVRRTPTRG